MRRLVEALDLPESARAVLFAAARPRGRGPAPVPPMRRPVSPHSPTSAIAAAPVSALGQCAVLVERDDELRALSALASEVAWSRKSYLEMADSSPSLVGENIPIGCKPT